MESWEARLQARTNELIAQRVGRFKVEIEQLQTTIHELSGRLLEQVAQEPAPEESLSLIDHVKQWYGELTSKAEVDFQTKLETTVSETAARTREEAAQEFQAQLEAHLEKARAEAEEEFQARLEQNRTESEQEFHSRLEQSRAESEQETQARIEQSRAEVEQEVQARIDQVRAEAEREFQGQLEQARAEIEREVQARIDQVRGEWEISTNEANEESFQKRLEQACSEAAAVARRESEIQIEDLVEQLEASRKALTLAVSSSQTDSEQANSFHHLQVAVDEIDHQRTQSETLTTLVRCASQFAPRVVFFVVKAGDAVGWKAHGFENGLNDDTVRQLTIPTQQPSLLHEALINFQAAIGRSSSPGDTSAILGIYGSPAPECAIAIPLVVRGKAAAVLYIDSGTQPESSINTAAIETLMRVASMSIELLPVRRGLDTPRQTPSVSDYKVTPISRGTVGQSTSPGSATARAVVSEPPPPELDKYALPEPAKTVETEAPYVPEFAKTPNPEWAERSRITGELVKPAEAADHWAEAHPQPEPVVHFPIKSEPEPRPEPVPVPELEFKAHPEPEPEPIFSTAPPMMEEIHSEEQFEESPQSQYVSLEPEPISEKKQPEIVRIPPPPPAPPLNPVYNERSGSAPSAQLANSRSTQEQELPKSPSGPLGPVPGSGSLAVVPNPASETEQRAHNDARRFARLLVSEIKLYNAAKVNEGRRNFDLYDRLKDEIDRSRRVYDKRVSQAVASRFDYFYDELVQTLAEGDPAKLGPGCPGPVVLAS
ncbi:MAG TPA: hypothetical protein VJ302_24530 [Blastocatellia bacterium]|nr:hypothetical protein [Blastocatellia bacterium]